MGDIVQEFIENSCVSFYKLFCATMQACELAPLHPLHVLTMVGRVAAPLVKTAVVRSAAVAPLNTARGKPYRSYLCKTTKKLWIFLETGMPHVHNNVDF